MAVVTIAAFHRPSPRDAAAASVQRTSPRVYSPFPARRLARPMAVPIGAAEPRRERWAIFRSKRDDRPRS